MIKKIETKAKIKCKICGHVEEVDMPTNVCQQIWKCPKCGEVHVPKKDDCCVFCSYADKQCPIKQSENL